MVQRAAYDEDEEAEGFTDIPQHVRLTLPYVITTQALLIVVELGGAMASVVFYVMITCYLTDNEWYAHFSFLAAFTYTLNDLLVMISPVMSPSTLAHLPRTTFYALHQCCAGIGYGFMGGPALTGLSVSLVHGLRTIINVLSLLSLEPD
ncbi:hypothetical protein MRX96_031117 [Rhipicephalus microplus]